MDKHMVLLGVLFCLFVRLWDVLRPSAERCRARTQRTLCAKTPKKSSHPPLPLPLFPFLSSPPLLPFFSSPSLAHLLSSPTLPPSPPPLPYREKELQREGRANSDHQPVHHLQTLVERECVCERERKERVREGEREKKKEKVGSARRAREVKRERDAPNERREWQAGPRK